MTVNEIIARYTTGNLSLEETNERLRAIGSNLYLNPDKNALTEEEIQEGTAGLLDIGVGSWDKVEIKDGSLVYAVNIVKEDGTTNMPAYVRANGKLYEVFGRELVEVQ